MMARPVEVLQNVAQRFDELFELKYRQWRWEVPQNNAARIEIY
jgi:hypothetical protein